MSYLIAWLVSALQRLYNFVVGLPLHLFALFLAGAQAFINAIPAPSFFSNIPGWIGSIPNLLAMFLSAMNIGTGMAIIVSAITIRFLIRRIPFIG